jgi:hypothetical protein
LHRVGRAGQQRDHFSQSEYFLFGQLIFGGLRETTERRLLGNSPDAKNFKFGLAKTGRGGSIVTVRKELCNPNQNRIAASAAVLHETGNFDSQDAVRGTPTSGVPESVPVRAYQCLWRGVRRSRPFRFGDRLMAQGRLKMKTNRSFHRNLCLLSVLFLLLIFSARVFATPVGQNQASQVASAFVKAEKARWQQKPETTPARFGPKQTATAVQAYAIKGTKEVVGSDNIMAAYVAELDPEGFVIISADDEIEPVLGFSFHGQFPFQESGHNVLLHLVKWDTAARQKGLKEAKAKGVTMKQPTKETQKWAAFLSGNQPDGNGPEPESLDQWPPDRDGWVTTTWDQRTPFNDACPWVDPDNQDEGRCAVGCTATAFSQIVNYWEYPASVRFDSDDAYKSKGKAGKFQIDSDHTARGFPSFNDLNSSLQNITYDGSAFELSNLCFAAGVKLKLGSSLF